MHRLLVTLEKGIKCSFFHFDQQECNLSEIPLIVETSLYRTNAVNAQLKGSSCFHIILSNCFFACLRYRTSQISRNESREPADHFSGLLNGALSGRLLLPQLNLLENNSLNRRNNTMQNGGKKGQKVLTRMVNGDFENPENEI